MIFFNFSRIFKLKGIDRPFSYLTAHGYSASTATKMANNKGEEMNLRRLEKFCRDFNCTPNDILNFRQNAKNPVPKNHALHSLTKEEISHEIATKINTLPLDKIQQIHDILKNME